VDLPTRLLARNTLFNLLGQGLPLLVALVTIPYVVRGLGPERFGLLSLAWVILGYFTVFDLGLGRATAKYVAELVARGDERGARETLVTAVVCQLATGACGAVLLATGSRALVTRIFRMPPELFAEAQATFGLVGLALPAVLAASSLLGALEARQRFDLANMARVPIATGTYLIPAAAVAAGSGTREIVALVAFWRWGCLLLAGYLNLRLGLTPSRRYLSMQRAGNLLRFGAWVMASGLLVPITVYLDRLLIVRLTSLQALTYYSIPYDLTQKLGLVSAAVAGAAFPAFSAASREGAQELAAHCVRLIVAGLGLPVVLMACYAEPLLTLWAGRDVAAESSLALRLLALASLLNGVGYVPYALVEARGWPRVVTLYHLLELPIYGTVSYLLIRELGINGAALAWLLRMGATIPLFSWLVGRRAGMDAGRWMGEVLGHAKALALQAAVVAPFAWQAQHARTTVSVFAWLVAGSVVVAWLTWSILLDEDARAVVRGALRIGRGRHVVGG